LFGVDINPNSVKICMLRLWIELLKNAYYKEPSNSIHSTHSIHSMNSELETLPNIDINIKTGNSLISRFPLNAKLDADLSELSKFGKKEKNIIEQYRNSVRDYKNERDRSKKKELQNIIRSLKNDIRTDISTKDPKLLKINKLKSELDKLENQTGLFEQSKKEQKEQTAKKKKFEAELTKLTSEVEDIRSNAIYRNAFEWRFEFPEVLNEDGEYEGFDVVIGNPPYIRIEQIRAEQVFYYKENYLSATGKFDLSSLFIEKALNILKPKHYCTYISTYQFLYTNSAIGLRKLILDKSIGSVIMFPSDEQIFDGATTYTGIFSFIADKSSEFIIKKGNVINKNIKFDEIIVLGKDNFESERVTVASTNIWDKILGINNIQKGIDIGVAKCGVVTSADNIYYVDNNLINTKSLERDIIYPILGPENLEKYLLGISETYCIYPYEIIENKTTLLDESIIKSKFPNIYIYLKENEEKLRKRSKGRDNYLKSTNWYQLNRPREKWIYDSIKIIYPGTTQKAKFAIDFNRSLFRNARLYSFILYEEDIQHYKCLTAILNSKFCEYLIRLKCPPKNNNYYELSTSFLDNFPFIPKEKLLKTNIDELVDKILDLKNLGQDTAALEDQIDRMVYELYGLTDEEIGVVEGKDKNEK